MLGYDRVILYNSETNGFVEGPLLEIEMEGGYQSVPHLNIGTYIENEWKTEDEVFHRAVEAQKKYDDAMKALEKVEYQLRMKNEKFAKYQPQPCEPEKEEYNWSYE